MLLHLLRAIDITAAGGICTTGVTAFCISEEALVQVNCESVRAH